MLAPWLPALPTRPLPRLRSPKSRHRSRRRNRRPRGLGASARPPRTSWCRLLRSPPKRSATVALMHRRLAKRRGARIRSTCASTRPLPIPGRRPRLSSWSTLWTGRRCPIHRKPRMVQGMPLHLLGSAVVARGNELLALALAVRGRLPSGSVAAAAALCPPGPPQSMGMVLPSLSLLVLLPGQRRRLLLSPRLAPGRFHHPGPTLLASLTASTCALRRSHQR